MSEPRLLFNCDHYTEGAVLDVEGMLFFSMTGASQIWISSTREGDAEPRQWACVPGANGHSIAADGSHVVMSSTGALLRLDESGRIAKVLATEVDGEPLIYPNGVSLDPHRGGFYATDSGYKQTPRHIDGIPKGRVVRVDAADRVSVVADGLAYANGVGMSPDGSALYVSASTTRRIWKYPVHSDGSLGERIFFADVPGDDTVPDGITVDDAGLLYVAHYGAGEVLVYAPDGKLERRIASGNRCTSHVAVDAHLGCAYVSGAPNDENGPGAIFKVDL
jgi:gluconolactonase